MDCQLVSKQSSLYPELINLPLISRISLHSSTWKPLGKSRCLNLSILNVQLSERCKLLSPQSLTVKWRMLECLNFSSLWSDILSFKVSQIIWRYDLAKSWEHSIFSILFLDHKDINWPLWVIMVHIYTPQPACVRVKLVVILLLGSPRRTRLSMAVQNPFIMNIDFIRTLCIELWWLDMCRWLSIIVARVYIIFLYNFSDFTATLHVHPASSRKANQRKISAGFQCLAKYSRWEVGRCWGYCFVAAQLQFVVSKNLI